MNLARIKTYIGLAMRAGQCKCGDNACKAAMMKGEANVLLINDSMSQGSRNRLVSTGDVCQIPILHFPPDADIGDWAGRPGSLCMTINDKGLADAIIKNYHSSEDVKQGVN